MKTYSFLVFSSYTPGRRVPTLRIELMVQLFWDQHVYLCLRALVANLFLSSRGRFQLQLAFVVFYSWIFFPIELMPESSILFVWSQESSIFETVNSGWLMTKIKNRTQWLTFSFFWWGGLERPRVQSPETETKITEINGTKNRRSKRAQRTWLSWDGLGPFFFVNKHFLLLLKNIVSWQKKNLISVFLPLSHNGLSTKDRKFGLRFDPLFLETPPSPFHYY